MLARIFIDRPIFAWVLSIVIILIGAVSALFLPIDMYPPITPPTVQVTASYPGANAKVVADTVAAPIEQQVVGVERMLYMSSQSTNDGGYTLTVTFEIGTDPNMAQVLVQNRVALATPQLPPQVQLEGINTQKTSPNILLAVNLVSPDGTFNDIYLSNYATIHIKDELSRLDGVGSVLLFGQRNYSMRIWLDPYKLAARSATAVDVVQAIQNQNIQVAAGAVGQQPVPAGQQLQLTMSALGQLETEQQFGDIIVKTGNPGSASSGTGQSSGSSAPANGSSSSGSSSTAASSPSSTSTTSAPTGTGSGSPQSGVYSTPVVRVRDVAEIEMGAQNYDQIVQSDGLPSMGLAIFQLPGSNALDVANSITKRMEELKRDFPAGLEYRIAYDTTPFIRQSVDDVFLTLLEAILLVAAVVLLFLQDWKAMILPMIDVPVSLVGTFAVMALLGFSLNNLTLFGLVLAIGIVVDDAIVVLENIERLIATGLDARAATIKAMDEITGPIIAITLVLCAVFIPSAFIPGLTGQFYRQFAVTIATAMLISALNALTLTPSRAVSIFKTEEKGEGKEMKKEALPWWIFGILGGALTVWLGTRYLHSAPIDRNLSKAAATAVQVGRYAIYFLPGALVGGIVGWFIIGRVNVAAAWVFGRFNAMFERATHLYGRTIGALLRLSAIVVVAYVGLLALTAWRVEATPRGFIPTQDQGYLLVNVQLPDSASVQRTQAIMEHIQRICLGDDKLHERAGIPLPKEGEKKYPGIAGVNHTVGVAGESFLLTTTGSNLGSMFVVLTPWDERHSSAEYDAAIAREIQQTCARDIEGAVIGVFRAPPIHGLGNAGGFKLQTEQRGYVDLNGLQAQTDLLVAKANADPRFAGVFSIYRAATPQLFVDIDRTKVQSLQTPIQDVFTTLQVDMGSLYVNQFVKFGRTWQVNVQAAPRFRADTTALKEFQVRNSQGEMVPLGTVLEIEHVAGPLLIMRYNMYTSAAINGTPAPGVSSGDVVEAITRMADDMGIKFEWTEMTFLQVEAGNVAMLVFALGAVFVYFVLAAKYESWRLPLAVILVVPLCMLAAVIGMTFARLPVDIFVQIGLLVLIGLASKNAILIVEYARQLHDEGKNAQESAIDAARIRFRPIIMTSLAFIFGVVPLVLASGAGAEMRQSLGIAVFSGMIGVTFFGVFLVPVFYYVLTWLADRRRTKSATTPAPDAAADGSHSSGGSE